jgi:hypothetical protein
MMELFCNFFLGVNVLYFVLFVPKLIPIRVGIEMGKEKA